MPRHEVSLEIEHAIQVGNVDVKLPVKVDGRPLGRLKISKGGVDWLPSPNSKTSYTMTWARFAEFMQENGRPKS